MHYITKGGSNSRELSPQHHRRLQACTTVSRSPDCNAITTNSRFGHRSRRARSLRRLPSNLASPGISHTGTRHESLYAENATGRVKNWGCAAGKGGKRTLMKPLINRMKVCEPKMLTTLSCLAGTSTFKLFLLLYATYYLPSTSKLCPRYPMKA